MVPVVREGFFDNLEPLSGKDARTKGSISFLTKKERMEQEIAVLRQRQEKAEAQMRRKQAQLALFNEEEEEDDLGGRVKVTMKDFALLQQFKAQQALQLPPPEEAIQQEQQPQRQGRGRGGGGRQAQGVSPMRGLDVEMEGMNMSSPIKKRYLEADQAMEETKSPLLKGRKGSPSK